MKPFLDARRFFFHHSKFESVTVSEIQWKFNEFQSIKNHLIFSGAILAEIKCIFTESQRLFLIQILSVSSYTLT